MKDPVARRLLDELLSGRDPEPSDISALMAVDGETEYLDFKHGNELEKKDAAHTIRQYVSGFANADGGLLVVGVSDGKPGERLLTDAKAPGGGSLAEWANRALQPIAGGLAPYPRIRSVMVGAKEVLVVATSRVPALVGCVLNGHLVHYLRVHDSTPAIPAYLMTDLLLGRRQHPILEVSPPEKGPTPDESNALMFSFYVTNESLVPARDVTVGVVFLGHLRPNRFSKARQSPATPYLLTFMDVRPQPVDPDQSTMSTVHCVSGDHLDLRAFEGGRVLGIEVTSGRPGPLPIPVRAALYCVSAGHAAQWYQMDWDMPMRGSQQPIAVRLQKCTHLTRPIVSWGRPAPAEGD